MAARTWGFHHRTRLLLLLAIFVVCLPSIASGQEAQAIVEPRILPREGVPFSPYSMATDFLVLPSRFKFPTCPGIMADQPVKKELFVLCVDIRGNILPNCNVQLTHEVRPLSGGHDHTHPNRPKGEFIPASGNTGPGGILPVMYIAPEVSGIINVRVEGTDAAGRPVTPGFATIGVRVPGLLPLPIAGAGFQVTPSVGHDNNNRFALPIGKELLEQLPTRFRNELESQGVPVSQIPTTLFYTSISLPEGGLFDVDAKPPFGEIDNPWGPPHCGHRFGDEADLDIGNIPQKRALKQAILDSGFFFPVVAESPTNPKIKHWHLRIGLFGI